ncbi:hypothetical protein BN59_00837 [Legionella massiliensis]|uniref:Uncharacterized protein n=1 Tax=Legionella massiliensis TaxID=1034943 RepID=A0A078KXV5_9GAMM|nr:hypothetical protein BN59_00837 [Legionella massiliensis]CEE12301.1 hypothetical protein BN1094_00837 [Legionella massiliensis]
MGAAARLLAAGGRTAVFGAASEKNLPKKCSHTDVCSAFFGRVFSKSALKSDGSTGLGIMFLILRCALDGEAHLLYFSKSALKSEGSTGLGIMFLILRCALDGEAYYAKGSPLHCA